MIRMIERRMPAFQDFPPADLLHTLVDLYFRRMNDYVPLLHEPTFKEAINSGLHLHHGDFGATVLLVCANAARFSADPRVLLEGQGEHSAGCSWFKQVEEARKFLFAPARLYDLQIYAVRVAMQKSFATGVLIAYTAHDFLSSREYSLRCVVVAFGRGDPRGSGCWRPSEAHVQRNTSRRRGVVEARVLVCNPLFLAASLFYSVIAHSDPQDTGGYGLVGIIWGRQNAMYSRRGVRFILFVLIR